MTVNLNDVKDAVREKRTITFVYHGEVRTVELTEVSSGDSPFITGHDLNRKNAFRRFTVADMRKLSVL